MAFRDFKRQCKEAEAKRQAERELAEREKHHSFQAPAPEPVPEDSPESYKEKTAADYLYKRGLDEFNEAVEDYRAAITTEYQDFEMANALWTFYERLAKSGAKYYRNHGLLKIASDAYPRFRELHKPENDMKEYCKATQQVCKEMYNKMPAWLQELVPPLVYTVTFGQLSE